jgi:hypothetical protein
MILWATDRQQHKTKAERNAMSQQARELGTLPLRRSWQPARRQRIPAHAAANMTQMNRYHCTPGRPEGVTWHLETSTRRSNSRGNGEQGTRPTMIEMSPRKLQTWKRMMRHQQPRAIGPSATLRYQTGWLTEGGTAGPNPKAANSGGLTLKDMTIFS